MIEDRFEVKQSPHVPIWHKELSFHLRAGTTTTRPFWSGSMRRITCASSQCRRVATWGRSSGDSVSAYRRCCLSSSLTRVLLGQVPLITLLSFLPDWGHFQKAQPWFHVERASGLHPDLSIQLGYRSAWWCPCQAAQAEHTCKVWGNSHQTAFAEAWHRYCPSAPRCT